MVKVSEHTIPKATQRRMPVYYRYFNAEQEKGTKRVSSKSISDSLQIDSATIRRDFSYFGELGRKGYGYNVDSLVQFFFEQLFGNTKKNVAVIGVGNLGSALLRYNFGNNMGDHLKIRAGFDIDPDIIGTTVGDYHVYDMKDLNKIAREMSLDIAVLTVPKESAREAVAAIEAAGIYGIMNFAPVQINGHETLIVHDVDLTLELQSLFFKMKLSRGEV